MKVLIIISAYLLTIVYLPVSATDDLFDAVKEGNLDDVKRLIKNGRDVNEVGQNQGYSLLHTASEEGHLDIVKYLVEQGVDVNALTNLFRNTPIYFATRGGYGDIVKYLIDHGANVNVTNDAENTPLLTACRYGFLDIVKTLLENGANMDVKDSEDKTPLLLALTGNYRSIAELLHIAGRPAWKACHTYKRPPVDRILNGVSAIYAEFPWMAALGYFSDANPRVSFDCGGTLISDLFVLTAAHCVKPRSPRIVRLGVNNLLEDSDTVSEAVNQFIEEIFPHPKHSLMRKRNDIALIKLTRRIPFTDSIFPACLYTDRQDINADVPLIVAGWGSTEATRRSRSNQLLKTQLKTVPMSDCNTTLLDYNKKANHIALRGGVVDAQYCASGKSADLTQPQNDSCYGDSGGPLQLVNSDTQTAHVVGVVSFGIDCGTILPSVYTRVAYHLQWIESIVWA